MSVTCTAKQTLPTHRCRSSLVDHVCGATTVAYHFLKLASRKLQVPPAARQRLANDVVSNAAAANKSSIEAFADTQR